MKTQEEELLQAEVEIELTDSQLKEAWTLHNALEQVYYVMNSAGGHLSNLCIVYDSEKDNPVTVDMYKHGGFGHLHDEYLSFSANTSGKIAVINISRKVGRKDFTLQFNDDLTVQAYSRGEPSEVTVNYNTTVVTEMAPPRMGLIANEVEYFIETNKKEGVPLSIPYAIEWILGGQSLTIGLGENQLVPAQMSKTTSLEQAISTTTMRSFCDSLGSYHQSIIVLDGPTSNNGLNGPMFEMSIQLPEQPDTNILIALGTSINYLGSQAFSRQVCQYEVGTMRVTKNGVLLWELTRTNEIGAQTSASKLIILPEDQRANQLASTHGEKVATQQVNIASLLLRLVQTRIIA